LVVRRELGRSRSVTRLFIRLVLDKTADGAAISVFPALS